MNYIGPVQITGTPYYIFIGTYPLNGDYWVNVIVINVEIQDSPLVVTFSSPVDATVGTPMVIAAINAALAMGGVVLPPPL